MYVQERFFQNIWGVDGVQEKKFCGNQKKMQEKKINEVVKKYKSKYENKMFISY